MGKIDLSAQLSQLDPENRAAFLNALEAKRKENHYIKYFQPNSPSQWEVPRKFDSTKKVFVVRGGNRSGKTEIGAAITVAWALGKDYFNNEPAYEWVKNLPIPEPPSNIWIVGLDFTVVRDVLWGEKLRNGGSHPGFIPRDDSLTEKISDSEFWVQFTNGSRIICKSADSGREKFQGASVDLIWIDEECDVEIFNECYQRTLDCSGKILTTLTPGLRTGEAFVPWVHELYEDYKAGKAKNTEFVAISFLDNPVIPDEEKDEAKRKWAGHIEERARLYGEFIQRTGLVYPMWNADRHVVRRFPIPKSWLRVASIDPAISSGTTAVLWGAVEPETNNLYLYREYYESDLPVSEHAKGIILRSMGDLVDHWIMDPKGGSQKNGSDYKSILQLYKEHGIPARLAEVDPDYGIAASIEYMQATTQATSRHPKVFVFNDLTNFQWEISRYTWAFYGRGEMRGTTKGKPIKKHDHLMNAYQYLCSMRPRSRVRAILSFPEAQREFSRLNSYT